MPRTIRRTPRPRQTARSVAQVLLSPRVAPGLGCKNVLIGRRPTGGATSDTSGHGSRDPVGGGRAPHSRVLRRAGVGVVAAGLAVAGTVVVVQPTPSAAVTPAANPPVVEECGIPVTLVLDASGSIDSSHAVSTVRNAASVFLTALKGTGSTARVIDFGSVARQTAPATLVTDDALAPGGALANALKAYYNPIPPLQPGVRAHAWNGRIPVGSASNYSNSTATQYTNWDQSLDQAGRQPSDLVVYVTDGDPTAVDSDQPGDPFFVPGKDPPDVRVGMSSGAGLQLALDRAVEEANGLKAAGTRMLAVGVGAAVTQPDSVARLTQIAGPQVVRDVSAVTSLNQVDVAVVPDFDDLAALLRKVVTAAVLTVPDDPQARPERGEHGVRPGARAGA